MKKSIEKIFNRPPQFGMVGDGFRVYNFIPGQYSLQRRMSPFLMLDFNPAYDFGKSETPRGVDVHPHKGFETVTIAYKGSVAHHDSAGNSGVINPGDVQWMTAGAGILHKEYHEPEFARQGGEFEMVQLWVNLPAKDKNVTPGYQSLTEDAITTVALDNEQGIVNIITGNYNGTKGAASTFTDVNVFDLKLKKDGAANFSIPAEHNTAVLVIEGNVNINGQHAAQHTFTLFANDGDAIEIVAEENSVVLVLSGAPIDEPIASYGPFVMNTQEEIIAAISDFNSGKFGVLN